MPTGNGSSSNKGKHAAAVPKAVGLRFEKQRLVVELDDQREVSVPLSRYPTLAKAKPSQRNAWELIGRGVGFHWESLDLDLSVRGLVGGLPEIIPPPPKLRRGAGTRRLERGAA
jgi:hypothetical protein